MIVQQLREEKRIGETDLVAYIDLDAHQGNGVCHQFLADRRVVIFDMYNGRNYPAYDKTAIRRIDWDVPLSPGCSGATYLDKLTSQLPDFLDLIGYSASVPLAIYNAGTDVFEGDILGGLQLSADDVRQRDLFVVEELRQRNIPVVMLLSGGYSRVSYQLVAASIMEFIERDATATGDAKA